MQTELGGRTPWLPQAAVPYSGAFRDNVRDFLTAHATAGPDVDQPRISCWLVDLHGLQGSVSLHIYEEAVDERCPAACDPCRIVGEMSAFLVAYPCPLLCARLFPLLNGGCYRAACVTPQHR